MTAAAKLAPQLNPEKLNGFRDKIVYCLHRYSHHFGDLFAFQIVVKSQDHRFSLSPAQPLDGDLQMSGIFDGLLLMDPF